MKTKNKHQHTRGEVTELARETAEVEQYWIVGDRSEPRKPPKNYNYVEELIHLQIELIKLQEYVRHNRLKGAPGRPGSPSLETRNFLLAGKIQGNSSILASDIRISHRKY